MKCAYVTLVMKGDCYVPGALALAYSLRQTGTKHALVCMVTSDVTGVDALRDVFDRVECVEYLSYNAWPRPTKRSECTYGAWMSVALTQFRCLGLVEYDKVCFLDADMLVHRNMDCIFNLRTPAGPFVDTGKPHGAMVYPNEIQDMIRRKFYVCAGSSLVLSPSASVYRKFLDYVDELYQLNDSVLGIKDMKASINEQIIVFFYSFCLRLTWTNVSSSFQNCWWAKPDPKMMPPFLRHYAEPCKPWENRKEKEWWAVAAMVMNDENERFFNACAREPICVQGNETGSP